MEDEARPSSSGEETWVDPSSIPSDASDCAEQQVMSEVHLGCPPHFSGSHISFFTFPCPPKFDTEGVRYNDAAKGKGTLSPQMIGFDEDGDLVLSRRTKSSSSYGLTIQHYITSSIPSVGLQVWRAELVLADFVLHNMSTSSDLDGIVALELGAGTGLLGIMLAHAAKTVFITDLGDDVLDNCATNVHLNSETFKRHQTSVHVRELDWNNLWPPKVAPDDFLYEKRNRYSWTPPEIEEAEGSSLLLAADVIYCDDLTDALFNTLQRLMSRGSKKVLYLALEKRYNFSLNDLNVVANGYSHFRSHLKDEDECRQPENITLPCFVGKRIDFADIPQYVKEYDRGNDVEIWQIKYLFEAN